MLIQKIQKLKKSNIAETIKNKIQEFEDLGKKKREQVFSELCFCILTANFQAEKCMKIQKEMGTGFLYFPEEKLAAELKKQGHRFPNTRANYIKESRSCITGLGKALEEDGKKVRLWLIENVKGMGFKEASHFLRNIGYKDVAIIDFHILDLLDKENIIKKPEKKTLGKSQYLEIEEILQEFANKVHLNLAELDLYLWYIETGKILK